MHKFFQVIALLGVVGIGWTGLPYNIPYIFISLIIISSVFFGQSKRTGNSGLYAGPLILSILLSTFIAIFLAEKRLSASNSRLQILEETQRIYSVSNSSPSEFILLNLVAMSKWVAALVFIPLLFTYRSDSLSINAQKVIRFWTLGVVINSGFAILNSLGIGIDFESIDLANQNLRFRFSGLSIHANNLSSQICLAWPLVVYLIQLSRKRYLFPLSFSYFFVTIILTGSRVGLSTFTLITLLILFNQRQFISRRALVASLAILALTFFLLQKIDLRFGIANWRIFSDAEVLEASNRGRSDLTKQAIHDFANNPFFGIGPQAFKSGHNIYLQLLASLGLFGFCAFVFLILKLFLSTSVEIEKLKALKISIFSFLIHGIFSNSLTDFYLFIPFGMLIAMAKFSERTRSNK